MSNFIVISSFQVIGGTAGDGYTNYIVPYLNGLVDEGHQVFAFGFAYDRREHPWHFGVSNIAVKNIPSVVSTLVANITIDAILIAMDIPHVIQIHDALNKMTEFYRGHRPKIIAVSAIEADPLSATAAINLCRLDKFIAISEFGHRIAQDSGINSVHVPALVDLNTFTRRTLTERDEIKSIMGASGKTVFFVNADGNERKNTALVFEALGLVRKTHPDIRLILLTRKSSPMSWDYQDLAYRFDLIDNVSVLDRTLSRKEVANLYRGSDFHINVSKAGGLELSILESQACGVPVIAGDWCGMSENISDGKGIKLPEEFHLIDVFLNGLRRFVSAETVAKTIIEYMHPDKAGELETMVNKAYQALIDRHTVNTYQIFREALI